jgi:hypothetical protein
MRHWVSTIFSRIIKRKRPGIDPGIRSLFFTLYKPVLKKNDWLSYTNPDPAGVLRVIRPEVKEGRDAFFDHGGVYDATGLPVKNLCGFGYR